LTGKTSGVPRVKAAIRPAYAKRSVWYFRTGSTKRVVCYRTAGSLLSFFMTGGGKITHSGKLADHSFLTFDISPQIEVQYNETFYKKEYIGASLKDIVFG
jgi:hypothetical protein